MYVMQGGNILFSKTWVLKGFNSLWVYSLTMRSNHDHYDQKWKDLLEVGSQLEHYNRQVWVSHAS